nr:fungal specific transcription factor [Colletotrichum truncatum]KAF6793300.1 fungal specific transcription factor [Colletotrichum truncatum]
MSTANGSPQSPQSSPGTKAPRGLMNCKPCQIRKIKCDRALPVCGVCHLYQRSCFYDGVPKKRGPKKESLSALIKRIDGLEELLKSEKTPTPPGSDTLAADYNELRSYRSGTCEPSGTTSSDTSPVSLLRGGNFEINSEFSATLNAEGLVDIYFNNFHCNPYEILDESATRQRLNTNQLPKSVLYAICAVATGFSEGSGKVPSSHVTAETYTAWSQKEIDPYEVSIDSCQALLLLVTAYTAMGNGKKAHFIMSQAVGMVMALELYSQTDNHENQIQHVDETRRKVFWTCYIINTFVSTWLERPSLMDDSFIKADILLSRQPGQNGFMQTGDIGQNPNIHPQKASGISKRRVHGLQSLVWVTQILSEANRYLLLSDATSQAAYCRRHKILHDLDLWASDASNSAKTSDQVLDGPGDNASFICRLVFHLIHCLIHRPILPLRLSESSGIKMIQHWVVEATETAFRHATAIVELVGQVRETSDLPMPPLVGFCIFTAATILNHGVYYAEEQNPQGLGVCLASFAGSPMSPSHFTSSPDLFSRCLNELSLLSENFVSARLFRVRLEELKAEHIGLLKGTLAGLSPNHSNRFFRKYSATLLQMIQGFHIEETHVSNPKSALTQSPVSMTHDDSILKEKDSTMVWNTNQIHHSGKLPFINTRPSMGLASSHHNGHQRSFSDSLPLSQSYAFDTTSPLMQRPSLVWPSFQDDTPRQGPTHSSPMLDSSIHLTSPIFQEGKGIGSVQRSWDNVRDFSGDGGLPYQVLSGPVAAAGSEYQQNDGLGNSFVPFHNFSVS